MASGTAPEPIDAVTLDPLGWPRGGRVSIGADVRFLWNVPTAEPSGLLMGVNHDIYVRTPDGTHVSKRIQALGKLVATPTGGMLELEGTGMLGGVVGAGQYPVLVYTLFPLWARGNLGEPTRR